jgi:N-methylhydantoinase A
VPRRRIHEIGERLLADGSVLTPLDEAEVAAVARRLAAEGFEAVAICFLHCYANPAHERRAAELVEAALPAAAIVASHAVLNEFREYERFTTTALNAAIAPRMRHFVGSLRGRLAAAGVTADLAIMTSNGGALPAERIEALPVLSMLSGPAAGVIAAQFIGGLSGQPNVIACDMGGTSTDVAVIRNGDFAMTAEGRIGSYPIRLRQIDINSIGAGGGSIAALDRGEVLSVGPRSAGAVPGPACYGRGGTEPTVTDANLVLGRLGGERLLGGEIRLDPARAEAALAALGRRLGLAAPLMAEGIIRLAVLATGIAIKEVSVMRGLDPRDFALLAYGGAGPLHAAAIADELGMRTVLVPPMPGNFSAFGLLVADIRRDLVQTRLSPTAETGIDMIRAMLRRLADAAASELVAAGVAPERHRFTAALDMRYAGQAFELSVPVPFDIVDINAIEARFRAGYAARYGAAGDGPSEIVSYRVAALGTVDKPQLPPLDPARRSLGAARIGDRPVWFEGNAMPAAIFERDRLPREARVRGPAVVEEPGSTILVPPEWTARLDRLGILLLERQ